MYIPPTQSALITATVLKGFLGSQQLSPLTPMTNIQLSAVGPMEMSMHGFKDLTTFAIYNKPDSKKAVLAYGIEMVNMVNEATTTCLGFGLPPEQIIESLNKIDTHTTFSEELANIVCSTHSKKAADPTEGFYLVETKKGPHSNTLARAVKLSKENTERLLRHFPRQGPLEKALDLSSEIDPWAKDHVKPVAHQFAYKTSNGRIENVFFTTFMTEHEPPSADFIASL